MNVCIGMYNVVALWKHRNARLMCMLGNSGMEAEVFKAARLGMLSFSQQLY